MNAKKNIEFKIGDTVVYPKHGVGEIVKLRDHGDIKYQN